MDIKYVLLINTFSEDIFHICYEKDIKYVALRFSAMTYLVYVMKIDTKCVVLINVDNIRIDICFSCNWINWISLYDVLSCLQKF